MSGFSIPGLGSGIDWSNYIRSIRAAEEAALSRTLGTKSMRMAQDMQVYGSIKGLVGALKTAVSGFDFVGDFKSKGISSSDENVVSGSAQLSALNQSATVNIERLATNELWQIEHSGVDDSTSTGGTFTITVRGVTTNLTVASGTTLTQLKEQINAANLGVTATVFSTGSGSATSARLSIQDNSLGKHDPDQASSNYNITIDLSAFNATAPFAVIDGDTGTGGTQPITVGKDAKFFLNNNTADPIYSDTNTVSNVLPGVTLTLKSASVNASTWTTISVTESVDRAGSKISSLLKKYNDTIVALRQAIAFDPNLEEQKNPTAGDGTLRSILQQIQNAFTGTVETLPPASSVRAMTDLGVKRATSTATSGGDGQLALSDENKLTSLLNTNYDDVIAFFQGGTLSGSTEKYDGWVKKMKDVLDGIVADETGSLSSRITSLQKQSKDVEDEINRKLERIDQKELRLKDRFARLESQLSKLSGQQSALQSAISSIQLNNQAIARR